MPYLMSICTMTEMFTSGLRVRDSPWNQDEGYKTEILVAQSPIQFGTVQYNKARNNVFPVRHLSLMFVGDAFLSGHSENFLLVKLQNFAVNLKMKHESIHNLFHCHILCLWPQSPSTIIVTDIWFTSLSVAVHHGSLFFFFWHCEGAASSPQ